MSFGEELRRERELRRISLREVATATKINLRYLEAMERNEFTDLPGGLFNRGFVRAYCEYIGVDPEGMVNAYLLEEREQSGTGGIVIGDAGLLRGRPSPRLEPEVPAPVVGNRRRWLLAVVLAGALIAAAALTLVLVGALGGRT
jgi:transcriptional regulator with XRE-family HTH domain